MYRVICLQGHCLAETKPIKQKFQESHRSTIFMLKRNQQDCKETVQFGIKENKSIKDP